MSTDSGRQDCQKHRREVGRQEGRSIRYAGYTTIRSVFGSTVVLEYVQKQYSRIEAGLLPSLDARCHEGIPGMSINKFIDEKALKTVEVLVGSPKRQDRNEGLCPLNLLLVLSYNRNFPGKSGLLFAVVRFISGIH
jgi:hypothetical protein